MKIITAVGFLSGIILSINVYCQSSKVARWESVFNSGTNFKYWSSNQGEPDANWRNPDFDDSNWNEGTGGIGFGDNDDGTVIGECISVALRKTFMVVNKSEIAEAFLYLDFDDAFVAYLNGTEIARSAGLVDDFPSAFQLSSQQHEAGTPQKFVIDSMALAGNLVNGINTLAIQVHNADANSTDLSSSAWFIVGLTTAGSYYEDVPDWFSAPFQFTSSNLPIFVINTENNNTIPDEPKIEAQLGIIYNGEGQINHLTDTFNHYNGKIGIELRGNSTQGFPKKPYNFETRNSEGENLNVSLFGWPAENDWVLRASYIDHTFIRNPLAMHMSRQMGHWASRCKLVEVMLNGEYVGIYILMEKIKVDKGRLDIAKLNPDEILQPDISGGYIYEISGFGNDMGQQRSLKYPKIEEVAPEQLDYIIQFDDDFRQVMQTSNYMDEATGYHAWIEVPTFVDELLVQEAMRNSDAYGWSGYFYKDKLHKISAGPVWDFDQSAGNSSYPDNGVVTDWMFSHPFTDNTPFFWPLLFEDPAFSFMVRQRWESLRAGNFRTEVLFSYIDSIASLLAVPQTREFEKWPVLGEYIYRETLGFEDRDTYQKEVDYLKEFLETRWDWIDDELRKYENPFPTNVTLSSQFLLKDVIVYPNPAVNYLVFEYKCAANANIRVDVYNNLGRLVQTMAFGRSEEGNNSFTLNLDERYTTGIYYFKLYLNNEINNLGKFVVAE